MLSDYVADGWFIMYATQGSVRVAVGVARRNRLESSNLATRSATSYVIIIVNIPLHNEWWIQGHIRFPFQ